MASLKRRYRRARHELLIQITNMEGASMNAMTQQTTNVEHSSDEMLLKGLALEVKAHHADVVRSMPEQGDGGEKGGLIFGRFWEQAAKARR
jgi:hypothetical protein